MYLGHRLAWLYVYGKWPNAILDHIDNNPSNNAIDNLREVSASQNLARMVKAHRNATGKRGVYPYGKTGKKFEAKLMHNYKSVRVGVFDNVEEAHAAYLAAAEKAFGEFSPRG
jgi:hypothetical protein